MEVFNQPSLCLEVLLSLFMYHVVGFMTPTRYYWTVGMLCVVQICGIKKNIAISVHHYCILRFDPDQFKVVSALYVYDPNNNNNNITNFIIVIIQ